MVCSKVNLECILTIAIQENEITSVLWLFHSAIRIDSGASIAALGIMLTELLHQLGIKWIDMGYHYGVKGLFHRYGYY